MSPGSRSSRSPPASPNWGAARAPTMSELIARQSPWGPLVVADAHVHFFSHRFFEILAETWARELDRHGVNRAALIASAPGDEASVTAAVRAHPDRFFAYAMVNPRAWKPETFSDIRVACLFPAMHGDAVQGEEARAA